jgi:ketosteroid isomerase-like protein
MAAQPDDIAREIEQLANEWMNAIGERDAEKLERFLAAEFRLASGAGMFVERADWLHSALHLIEGGTFAYSDVQVRRYGDIAIMQSHWTQRVTRAGAPWNGSGLMTDVWIHRDGRWQVLARHSSLRTE